MAQILNTWESKKSKLEYYDIDDKRLIAKNGDYAAYSEWEGSVIYTYKNIAINNLAGYKKTHLDRLAKEERPDGEYSPLHFIFDRAMESKQKGLALLANNRPV